MMMSTMMVIHALASHFVFAFPFASRLHLLLLLLELRSELK